MPTPQTLSPTHQDSFPASPPRRQCRYHICTYIPLHSLSPDPTFPSNRLLLSSSFHPWWSSRGTEVWPAAGCQAHSLDNAGLLYAGIQCLENNVCFGVPVERRLQGNELVHPPTGDWVSVIIVTSSGIATYPFHPETSTPVHHVEEVIVFLAPKPV